MNKRQWKKAYKNKIKKLSPRVGDVVIIQFDIDEYDPVELEELFKATRKLTDPIGCKLWVIPNTIDMNLSTKITIKTEED